MFRKYPKVHALGKDETRDILIGDDIYIQEKIDGANTSIWYDREKDQIFCGSRNQLLNPGSDFRGFCNYVYKNDLLIAFLKKYNFRMYGEWLSLIHI